LQWSTILTPQAFRCQNLYSILRRNLASRLENVHLRKNHPRYILYSYCRATSNAHHHQHEKASKSSKSEGANKDIKKIRETHAKEKASGRFVISYNDLRFKLTHDSNSDARDSVAGSCLEECTPLREALHFQRIPHSGAFLFQQHNQNA
jgi:hypothetical protein